MENSPIQWTDHTLNGWIGCTRVSEECDNCYAAALDKRYGYTAEGWGHGAPRKLRADSAWREPLGWNQQAAADGYRAKVFCSSLADVFDAEVPADWRARLFALIAATPHLDWQLLTKRPQLIQRQLKEIGIWNTLPLPNVWLGFSAGNQRNFEKRWPHVREVPATVRFCSYEPALGPLTLPSDFRGNLHWLICGGETNPRRDEGRRMLPEWARGARDQCGQFGVAFFFKQWGNWIPDASDQHSWLGKTAADYKTLGHQLDGKSYTEFPDASIRTIKP